MGQVETAPYVEHASAEAFAPTLARLEAAIVAAGMTIFARIDHAAAARDVGLTMPPTTVLIYGNPRGGTPIMVAAPRAALDLPLHILVREDPGHGVTLGFHPIAATLALAGVSDELAMRLEAAQNAVLQSALKETKP